MSDAYQELERRFARMSAISGANAVLRWDHATMMPAGGAEARARQMSTLSVLGHEILTAPDMPDLLAQADQETGHLDEWHHANLREMRRNWRHASAVPSDLVSRLSLTSSKCEMVWREARDADDFAALAPILQELVGLVRESGEVRGESLGISNYDALIDRFDPGGRVATIDPLFAQLQEFLPPVLAEVMERQAMTDPVVMPDGPFAIELQDKLARRVMERMGFDFDHGRLDTSHHPFTGGVPEDSRITTRYEETDFTTGLMAVIHETGHSLYERGLPSDWIDQPVGKARGMTLHESQSLLYEMQAARSPQFIGYLATLVPQIFGADAGGLQAEDLVRVYHKVSPGLIRVDADEVTYPLHVILRYRLERQMIDGTLKVADLPEAWREGMQDLLGVAPDNNADGCMQDIHWPSGAFGYFPSYTLGALAAAQIFAAATMANGSILPAIANGDFAPLNAWLRTHIHSSASRHSTERTLQQATREPLGVAAFKAHIDARYLAG